MKNKLILGAAFLLAAITESLACTNLIVGKGASVDGSVIVSYSADSYGIFARIPIIDITHGSFFMHTGRIVIQLAKHSV